MSFLANRTGFKISPKIIGETAAFLLGFALTAVIAMFDYLAGSQVLLNPLYIFPIALVAFFSGLWLHIAVIMALSLAAQLTLFISYPISNIAIVLNESVSVLAATLMALTAGKARTEMLALERLATTDKLTGLANRDSFLDSLTRLVESQRRQGGYFCLAILDLDGFKLVNDSKGHRNGDIALLMVADILQQYQRSGDCLARLGGDEFALLLTSTNDADCLALCRLVCDEIGVRLRNADFAVTASVGCGFFQNPPATIIDAVESVDTAVYEAKERGRGRVVLAG